MNSPWQPARRTERMNPSVIREILELAERLGIVSLAGGLPSPDTFVTVAPDLIAKGIEALARVLEEAA